MEIGETVSALTTGTIVGINYRWCKKTDKEELFYTIQNDSGEYLVVLKESIGGSYSELGKALLKREGSYEQNDI